MRRKIIIIAIAVVILIGLGFFAYNFFTSEQVTIKSNSQNAKVSIYTLDDQIVESKNAPYSARMKPGNYSVSVTEGEKETRSAFTLELGKPIDLTLDLTDVKVSNQVAPYSGTYMFAADNFLNFLRNDVNQIDRLTFGEKYLKVLSQGSYGQAYWAAADQAVLVDTAGNNHFYDNGLVRPLGYELINPSTISLWNGTMAYINNDSVFIRPSITAEPRASFAINYIQADIALGPEDLVVVFETGIPGEAPDAPNNVKPAIYKGSEKQQSQSDALKDFFIDGATWSPNGQKLAFSAGDGLYVLDMNSSKVEQLYLSYTTHPQSLQWLDDQNLIYFLDQKIWQISVGNDPKTLILLAKADGSLSWSAPLVLSPDKKTIYYSSQGLKSSNDGIYSISLK